MSKGGKTFLLIIASLFVAMIAAYCGVAIYMNGRFFPSTTLNGVDVSFMTKDEARAALSEKAENYSLTVIDGFGRTETFTKDDLGLYENAIDRLELIQSGQKPIFWGESLYTSYFYEDSNLYSIDIEKTLNALRSRDIIKYAGGKKTEDAYITYDDENKEFVIVPEVYGNIIDPLNIAVLMGEKAGKLYEILDTKVDGGYVKPSITSNNEELKNDLELYNSYKDASVKYVMKGAEEYVGPETYVGWLVTDGEKVSVDRNKVKAFVKQMAEKYDTFGTDRRFTTSWGDVVSIKGGEEYGWEIDQEKEVAQLMSEIISNRHVERDFNYTHEAESHGNTDLGDTYIEVNFTKQHLYLYKEGKPVLDTDVVTGNTSRGMNTPTGVYHIYHKQKNRVLVGENYRTFVNYWMPFYKAYGLHDATWRKEFGKDIYKRSGSHGCVNMPKDKAAELYDAIDVGYLVITYNEE